MRRIIIASGFLAFLIYCWASVAYQNQVPVPGYRLVEVDLLGGKARPVWDAEPQTQFQRLMELEGKHYQLPEDAVVPAGTAGHAQSDGNGTMPVDRPLNSDDFAHLIASAPAGGAVRMRLRDASAIYDLLGRHYLLRDNIELAPANGERRTLYIGGAPLTKEMLDDLRGRGVKTVTVTGHAAPVNFQAGTAIMIAIIFFTLVAGLKPVVWDPFLAMLEKRRRELDIGAEAERQNQLEATRFEEERRRREAELYREIQDLRLTGQRETATAAAAIVKEAREKEKEIKTAGLREIGREAREAGEAMDGRVPELAEAIAQALTPGLGGPRWEMMADERER